MPLGDREQSVERAPVLIGRGHRPAVLPRLEPRAGRRRLALAVLAGEEAAAERAPDEHAQAECAGGRDQLALGIARDEAPLQLNALVAGKAAAVGRPERLGQTIAGVVRAADVADFAGPLQIVERPERLLDRHAAVLHMYLI